MALVSVIIPSYNRAHLILRSINSVLSQTLEDFELLIIDDGSTDNTQEVIHSITDDRIRYIRKKNGGVSSARNLGLSEANSKYIAFLDDDDEWPENYLQEMVKALELNASFNIAYCRWRIDNSEQFAYPEVSRTDGKLTVPLFKKGFTHIIATLFRADKIKNTRFDTNLRIAEDSDFFLRLSLSNEFIFVPSTFGIQNSMEGSLTSNFDECRVLSLERFYFKLGGDKVVPPKVAFAKLSKSCRAVAKHYGKNGNQEAAGWFYRKAIRYRPLDLRNYIPYLNTRVKGHPGGGWQPKTIPDAIGSE